MKQDQKQAQTQGAPAERAKMASLGFGAAGVVAAVTGLWLVSRGDITAAPILLVLAYLVFFPLALTR